MPPKQRITKEMVVQAAFEIARENGMEQVVVQRIARRMDCSVQPIYSYCENMEGLRREVVNRACDFARKYVMERMDKEDVFRSIGRAYLQLAKEEPHLYKIFVMHRREGIASMEDLYRTEADPSVAERIREQLNLSLKQAKQLHIQMMIYTIGMGSVFAMTSPGIPADEVFAQQELAYGAFLNQAIRETEKEAEPQ